MNGASGWQPIETAPRDGTPVIGYNPKWSAEHRMIWDEDFSEWKFYQANLNYAGLFWGDQPSCWRPAPDLPKACPRYTEADAPPYDGGPETDDFGSA